MYMLFSHSYIISRSVLIPDIFWGVGIPLFRIRKSPPASDMWFLLLPRAQYAQYSICGKTEGPRGHACMLKFDYFWWSMKSWGWGNQRGKSPDKSNTWYVRRVLWGKTFMDAGLHKKINAEREPLQFLCVFVRVLKVYMSTACRLE